MSKNFRIRLFVVAFMLATMPALRLSARPGADNDRRRDDRGDREQDRGHDRNDRDRDSNRHVLLISIDGMHAVDYEICAANNTCPHLAALGKTGVTYTRTSTPRPSDSFPGLMALVTGGTPKTAGAFYDVL